VRCWGAGRTGLLFKPGVTPAPPPVIGVSVTERRADRQVHRSKCDTRRPTAPESSSTPRRTAWTCSLATTAWRRWRGTPAAKLLGWCAVAGVATARTTARRRSSTASSWASGSTFTRSFVGLPEGLAPLRDGRVAHPDRHNPQVLKPGTEPTTDDPSPSLRVLSPYRSLWQEAEFRQFAGRLTKETKGTPTQGTQRLCQRERRLVSRRLNRLRSGCTARPNRPPTSRLL
jgi:hypothetical protein